MTADSPKPNLWAVFHHNLSQNPLFSKYFGTTVIFLHDVIEKC